MAIQNKRFTIMTFPQRYDGANTITLNILFLPRNQNPFAPAIEGNPPISDAPAFVDAQLRFEAKFLQGTEHSPNTQSPVVTKTVAGVKHPANKHELFTSLADPAHFNIVPLNTSNQTLTDANEVANSRKVSNSVKKYLPISYRRSFNFISPRHPNAVIDDSYHCAVRSAKPKEGFKQSTDTVSWGKVFAFLLRNPVLAEQAGFIYASVTAEIDDAMLAEGSYLYIDLAADSDYYTQQHQEPEEGFVKLYAARIPALTKGIARPLFAANLFPVLYKASGAPIDPPLPGNYDNIFIEAADYDDGFAKITHCFQPVSQHLLQEESDGFHPTHESGIRLGWDDEQILQWYVRQMAVDDSVKPITGTEGRIDAPAGMFGYHIDVRADGDATWHSLNTVATRDGVNLLSGLVADAAAQFTGELPFQVYPSTLDGQDDSNFWLPMYFANWNGHSMVLPNEDEIKIFQHDEAVQADARTNVTGKPDNNLLKIYEPQDLVTKLKYGSVYHFRMRMTDMTNGGPAVGEDKVNDAEAPETTCHFRRFVAPSTVRIKNVPFNTADGVFNQPALELQRPVLSYPAVDYCDKYKNVTATLISKLKAEMAAAKAAVAAGGARQQLSDTGLADPDVDRVEITVEVQALQMDYQLSESGRESYALLYRTERAFPERIDNGDEYDYDNVLNLALEYRDAHVLTFGDSTTLGDLGVTQDELDNMAPLVLPTARQIRLTIRAVCEKKTGYYGLEKTDPAYNTRYGRTSYIRLYQPSVNEKDLYSVSQIQGIYLQPDPIPVAQPILQYSIANAQAVSMPDSVQRLAQQLKIESTGLSLVGKKGERIQFGCSARIRHTLSPDNSSLTFASKAELYHHWLCCITLELKRDWTWDALQDWSFIITRKKYFTKEPGKVKEEVVGEMDMKHAISFTALQDPQRSFTKLVFIDAVEPKKEQGDAEPEFPDMIDVTYTVQARFKAGHGATTDADLQLDKLRLPVTINPVQIPKIASAGIALSPYHRNEKYSVTEPRRRFLWIEFTEPVKDPNDLFFARVLNYAPDQLISNNQNAPQDDILEPPLNIDPEYTRVISAASANDEAGIEAMQVMEKSLLSDRHYLLPLPPGLNEASPELFGFFTYEFRVGHASKDLWSTAQGRYGRPLRATGIQHPAPTLTCAVHRDEDKLYATAPYATAVLNGKNVTANPPRTQLWCLLYAQVKQADNNDANKDLKDYRNILLDDRFMHWSVKIKHRRHVDIDMHHITDQPLLNVTDVNVGVTNKRLMPLISPKLVISKMQLADIDLNHLIPITFADIENKNEDATKYGTTLWTNDEVNKLLKAYGLPLDLPLSVLCVEVFTNITNERDYRTRDVSTRDVFNYDNADTGVRGDVSTIMAVATPVKPLSNSLGNYRILRTSPLVEVPFVCCTE